jgi:phospholipase/carboxylesterase
VPADDASLRGLLLAHPSHPNWTGPLQAGTIPIGLGHRRDGLVHVPASWSHADQPGPLLLMLHGAGGSAGHVLPMVREVAESHGVLVLAPDARDGPGT